MDGGSFPIELVFLYYILIEFDLLGFMRIDVLAYELLNHDIKTFASQIPLNDMYSYGFRTWMHFILWSPTIAHHHKQ